MLVIIQGLVGNIAGLIAWQALSVSVFIWEEWDTPISQELKHQ